MNKTFTALKATDIFIAKHQTKQEENQHAQKAIEPSHEIMALFVLHKLILRTRMRSHLVGLDV